MSARLMITLVGAASLLLAACGQGSGEPTAASSPPAPPSTGTPTPEASSAAPEPTTSSDTESEPTDEPTPSVIRLTGDELLEGLPTNRQLSTVQGRTFKENDTWVGGADAGPQWVNDAPLTKKQRSHLALGGVRKVKPQECTVVAFSDGWGLPSALANRDAISAAAYSKRVNDYQYYRAGNVYLWMTVALVLAPGQAQVWAEDWANTRMKCTKYTVIDRDGDVERVSLGGNYPKGKSMFTSGDAYIANPPVKGAAGPFTSMTIIEAIGDTYYETYLRLAFTNTKQMATVTKAYNKLANNLAKASGVTRDSVDLSDLTPFKGDPKAYIAPTEPLSAGSRV